MKLTEVCIRRPLLAWMMMAATIVFGLVAGARLGISQLPDVDFPTISVSASWEGAAPEVIEHDVIEVLEEALMQVEGVRNITSSARMGSGNVSIELDLNRDVDVALQDVQTRVAQANRRLPRDLDPPTVSKTNPEDQPIMWVGLSGPYPRQLLSDIARYRIKERLQTVPGIGEVQMGGALERNVRLWVDASKLDDRGVTVSEVVAALQKQHVELPAGRLESGGRETNVRVLGEALDLETLRSIVVREENGAPIYLGDVALVEDGFEDVRRMSRVNGVPAQGLGIRKQRGANAVAVADGVMEALDELKGSLPEGMELGINFDSTRFIRDAVHDIEWELLLAVILTALVCWLFLGSLSSTLNVVLAIPMSLMGTVAVIYFLGFTLNTFTLLALSLAVGIVVDDAIMVLENIFRHSEAGKDRVKASYEGTREIAFAALAATVAVVAIFLPVVFMEGVIGRFFLQFGVTLSVAVLLSYVEAVTLAPARCAQLLSSGKQRTSRLGQWVDDRFHALSQRYARALAGALRRPYWVLGLALVIFAASGLIYWRMPSELVPSQDQSRLMVRLQTAVGSTIDETDRVFRRAEAFAATLPEVNRVFGVVGGFGGGGVNTGILFVTMVPPRERQRSQADIQGVLRKELNSYPGVRAMVMDLSQQGLTSQRGFPVEFSVRGGDWNALIDESKRLTDQLRESGVVVDLDTDYEVGVPELRISPDRARAADLGVDMDSVATTINALVGGVRVGKYSTGGRRVDVRLRLLASQRQRPEDVARLKVRTASGELVPLSLLVAQEERPALQSITRRQRERAITITANVAAGHSQNEALALVAKLGKQMPPGTHLALGGASVAFEESWKSLLFALALGIIVAYMVLVAQFNSLVHPITVLTILPLSAAGAAMALWASGRSLNIFSMIGLLLLLGIVKKNSILLVDYANQVRERGKDAIAAMREAGPVRLRPILMTSVATMMAALPAALGLGEGGEVRAPMAIGVLGGLILSTALSLFVVPAFYVLTDRWQRRLRPARAEDGSSRSEAPLTHAPPPA